MTQHFYHYNFNFFYFALHHKILSPEKSGSSRDVKGHIRSLLEFFQAIIQHFPHITQNLDTYRTTICESLVSKSKELKRNSLPTQNKKFTWRRSIHNIRVQYETIGSSSREPSLTVKCWQFLWHKNSKNLEALVASVALVFSLKSELMEICRQWWHQWYKVIYTFRENKIVSTTKVVPWHSAQLACSALLILFQRSKKKKEKKCFAE